MFAAQAGISEQKRFPTKSTGPKRGPGRSRLTAISIRSSDRGLDADTSVQMRQSYATLGMTLGGASAASTGRSEAR